MQSIVEFFGAGHVVLCGSLADFYWLGWGEVGDFDMEIAEDHLLSLFQLDEAPKKIVKNKFGIYLSQTKIFPRFYRGQYHKSKLDLFLKKNPVSGEAVNGEAFNLTGTVQIDSAPVRISMLKHLLKFTSSSYQNEWMKKKNAEAKLKLSLYREKFPHLFKTQYAIRR